MRTSRFTEAQIIAALRRQEAGEKSRNIFRYLCIAEVTFYAWKAKYGSLTLIDRPLKRRHITPSRPVHGARGLQRRRWFRALRSAA